MGTSWISRKEGILEIGGLVDLEKGGMNSLTNYVGMFKIDFKNDILS